MTSVMIPMTYMICPLFKHMSRQGGGSPPGTETGDGHIRIMVERNSHKIKRLCFIT